MRSLTIQIPQPCHERWADMQPNEQGRFCASCQKTVVDYTALSDQELIKLLAKSSENSCGRFYNEQLDRPLIAANPLATSVWRQWLGLLTLSLFGWQTTRAQQNQMNHPARPASAEQASVKIDYSARTIPVRTTVGPETMSTITGKVMVPDSSGSLLPTSQAYVSIEQAGHRWYTHTDSTGFYQLRFPTRLLTTQLTVYARTYNGSQGNIMFDASTPAASIAVNDLILEKPAPRKDITGGGICLIQTPSRWQKIKRKLFR